MKDFLIVGLGSFIGGVGRYACSGLLLHQFPNSKFPFGTFVVNIVGCLLIGLIGGIAEKYHMLSPSVRLFAMSGFLGGFTTFSAFGFETLFLIRRGEFEMAFAYVLLSLLFGLGAVALGTKLILNQPA